MKGKIILISAASFVKVEGLAPVATKTAYKKLSTYNALRLRNAKLGG